MSDRKPWERQPGETAKAYDAFLHYRDLPAIDRSVEAAREGVIRIIQGFMAFGLLVGIAGLGVVSARAVYQRKEQIGTLRALGFRREMVLAYFLVEASFVAMLGILLGVAAGTLAGFRMYLSEIRDDIGGPFSFPAMEVGGLVALVYIAAMAFTIASAIRAAWMPPVEALRPRE